MPTKKYKGVRYPIIPTTHSPALNVLRNTSASKNNSKKPTAGNCSKTGMGILLAIGSISIQQQITKMTIYIRRAWGLAYTYLVVSFGIAFITVSSVNAEWLVIAPALSLIISQSFCLEKSKRFSSFTFYFSLLLLIFCQLTLNK